jgi:DNA-binding response OmpR family regulator
MPSVLVIDDEPLIVSFVQRALQGQGLRAEGATDGASGLELTLTGRYDLVLLDLVMPVMEGADVLAETMRRRPEQAVMVLSALTDVDTKVRCFGLGAADYLAKPFALAELLARVHACLRAGGARGDDAVLHAGGITLDLGRRTADVGTGPIPVSGREFLLLRHLMRRAGHVCTRQELLGDVWGYSFDPGTNVVDVYVRRLRSKLGPLAVATVRNRGYRVDA